MVLLWGLALFFVLPQIAAAIALASEGTEVLAKGQRVAAIACFAGALLWASLWALGMWFCGTRGYEALLKALA